MITRKQIKEMVETRLREKLGEPRVKRQREPSAPATQRPSPERALLPSELTVDQLNILNLAANLLKGTPAGAGVAKLVHWGKSSKKKDKTPLRVDTSDMAPQDILKQALEIVRLMKHPMKARDIEAALGRINNDTT